jgi:quinol monooxygenase YgiN
MHWMRGGSLSEPTEAVDSGVSFTWTAGGRDAATGAFILGCRARRSGMAGRISLHTAATFLVALVGQAGGAVAQDSPGKGYAQIPGGAYSIVAEVRAKPGKEAELRAATLPLIDLVRGDPKNLVYFLQENREVPGHFIFYEIFANQIDFEAHNAMPYVQEWFAKLPELAHGGVKVMRMEILARPGN